MIQRKVTYRLYPNRKQAAALEHQRWVYCLLWNTALDERRRAWKEERRSLGFHEQCRVLTQWRKDSRLLSGLNAQSEQVVLKRLDLAFRAFFRRLKKGMKPAGYPRFKPVRRFKGWGYKTHGDGWRLVTNEGMRHGSIRLAGVGSIRLRGKPRTPGVPKTCEILFKNGRWYASVTLECTPKRQAGTKMAGLDWGLETFAVIESPDGSESLANPRLLKGSLQSLRKIQRAVSRKEEAAKKISGKIKAFPVSNRLKKAYGLLRACHEKTFNRRKDFLHKTSARLIGTYRVMAVEDLNIKKMTRNGGAFKKGLNRSILDTGGAAFHRMLGSKAEEAGSWVFKAPTQTLKPSQTCHTCGRQARKALWERWHICQCGASCSRDENAARVLLFWLQCKLSGREPADAWREVRPGRFQQAQAFPVKRETHAIAL